MQRAGRAEIQTQGGGGGGISLVEEIGICMRGTLAAVTHHSEISAP